MTHRYKQMRQDLSDKKRIGDRTYQEIEAITDILPDSDEEDSCLILGAHQAYLALMRRYQCENVEKSLLPVGWLQTLPLA